MNENIQASAILSAGMRLLRENLGLIESEIFIYAIKNKNFDYTEWSQNLYEDLTIEELLRKAKEYERDHPELIPKNAKII